MSPLRRLLIALWVVAVPALHPLAAQQVEREVHVPLDPEIGLVEVNARLRSDLALFPEIAGFTAARLFRAADGSHVLEISYIQEGTAARERRRLTDAGLAALRADLRERLQLAGRARVLDREGRAGFIVGQTAVGLGYHAWAVPVVLDFDSGRGVVAAYLLTAGASFLVPWLVSANIPMTVAQRDASFWGATRGIAYGHLAGGLAWPEDPVPHVDDESASRARIALGSLGSVLGSLAGYRAAERAGQDPGTVALWGALGDFGLAGAFGTSYALGLYRGEEVWDDFQVTRRGSAASLALGLGSLYAARFLGDGETYTPGDARALRSFGILGAQALLPLAVELFEDAEEGGRGVAAAAVLGGAAGLALGNRALRPWSLTGGEGLLVLAGHVAGGLTAAGITYLLDSGETAKGSVYLATSAAGSAVGSLLTFRSVRGPGLPGGSGVSPARTAPRGLRGAGLTLHPEGVVGAFLPSRDSGGFPARLPPLLTLTF